MTESGGGCFAVDEWYYHDGDMGVSIDVMRDNDRYVAFVSAKVSEADLEASGLSPRAGGPEALAFLSVAFDDIRALIRSGALVPAPADSEPWELRVDFADVGRLVAVGDPLPPLVPDDPIDPPTILEFSVCLTGENIEYVEHWLDGPDAVVKLDARAWGDSYNTAVVRCHLPTDATLGELMWPALAMVGAQEIVRGIESGALEFPRVDSGTVWPDLALVRARRDAGCDYENSWDDPVDKLTG